MSSGTKENRQNPITNRRDQFENQLKELQRDIGSLSDKLQRNGAPPFAPHSTATIGLNSSAQSRQAQVNESYQSSVPAGSLRYNNNSSSTTRNDVYEKLRFDLHEAKSERDDAAYRLSQATEEIAELRKGLLECSRLRASYDHLKQDYDSLRVSLESSERIRKQQKDLIGLLQRSHAMSSAAVNSSAVLHTPPMGEVVSSSMSLNSVSTISHRADASSLASSGVRAIATATAADAAAENRKWLNGYSSEPAVTVAPSLVVELNSNSSGNHAMDSSTVRRQQAASTSQRPRSQSATPKSNSRKSAVAGAGSSNSTLTSSSVHSRDSRGRNDKNISSNISRDRKSPLSATRMRSKSQSSGTRIKVEPQRTGSGNGDARSGALYSDYRSIVSQNPSLLPTYDTQTLGRSSSTTAAMTTMDIPVRNPSYSTTRGTDIGYSNHISPPRMRTSGKPPRHPTAAPLRRVPQYQPVLESSKASTVATTPAAATTTARKKKQPSSQQRQRSLYRAIPTPSTSFTKASRAAFA